MALLRNFHLSYLKHSLTLGFVLPLAACSGGYGGPTSLFGSNSFILSWDVPAERADGSTLEPTDIGGYRIYYGIESGVYLGKIDITDAGATQLQVSGVPSGKYFAVMTTIDTNGRESAYSSPEIDMTF